MKTDENGKLNSSEEYKDEMIKADWDEELPVKCFKIKMEVGTIALLSCKLKDNIFKRQYEKVGKNYFYWFMKVDTFYEYSGEMEVFPYDNHLMLQFGNGTYTAIQKEYKKLPLSLQNMPIIHNLLIYRINKRKTFVKILKKEELSESLKLSKEEKITRFFSVSLV